MTEKLLAARETGKKEPADETELGGRPDVIIEFPVRIEGIWDKLSCDGPAGDSLDRSNGPPVFNLLPKYPRPAAADAGDPLLGSANGTIPPSEEMKQAQAPSRDALVNLFSTKRPCRMGSVGACFVTDSRQKEVILHRLTKAADPPQDMNFSDIVVVVQA